MGGGLPEFDDDRNLREKPAAPTDQNKRPRREDERTSGDDIFSPGTGGRISEHANEFNISNPYFRDGGHDNKSSPLPDRESATFRSYQLMEITSDRQDLSFVDKVLVLEDQISALSNDLVPESALLKVGRLTKLDFDLLDTTSFSAVGFYGDKEMMIKIFSNENLLSTEFLVRMHADSLKPGLYACLKSNHVYLFYWNGSKQMTDASRKDVSCNFVRYLVELCGSVYACVQGESIQKSLKNSTSSFPRQHRTQRLQISLRQESEDDLKLSDGFKVALPRTCFGASFDASEGLQLSQGLHRFAVLSCCVNPRKVVSKTLFETVGATQISCFLSSHSYSVRYTDLPDEEFLQLLNVLHRDELLEAYQKEQAGWNQRSLEAESKLHKINLLKKNRETQILEAFDRALPSYLTQKRQWEESLVTRCMLNSTSPSNTDASGKNVRLQNSTTDGLVKGEDISGGSASLSSDHDRCALGDLEIELCHIWSGAKDTDHRLLFSGAEFELFSASGGASLGIFIIEGMDDAGAVPICFGKEAVVREKDETKGAKQRIKFLRGDTNGFAKGPVVTSVETELLVEIQGIKNSEKFSFLPGRVRIRRLDSSNCCMTRWLDALSGEKLPRMQKYATFLSLLVEKKGDKLAKDEKLLRKLLNAESARSLRELLPKEMLPLMDDFWRAPQNPSVVPRIHSMVADLSAQLYSKAREGFLTAIRSFVKKEILPLLQEKFEMDAHKEVKAIKDVISREKKDYMSAMKEKMSDTSTRVDQKKLLTLKGVNFTDANSSLRKIPLISWLTSSTKVKLKYVEEGLEAETITWKAIEMVPSKRDVDEVMSAQSGRALVPSFTAEAVELITLEPSLERLDRVLLLKSGQVLIFVLAKDGSYLQLYVCPRLGVSMTGRNPSKVFRRGLDLVAVDEASRFMAMYNRNTSTIQAFRFDESFQHMDWTGIDIQLSEFSGNNNIVWMQFVPGKRELLLADDDHRIRVFELAPAMMKPRHISLPFPFTKACITPDANCLIVFTTGSPVPVPEETHDDNGFVVLQQQQDSEEYPDIIDIPASHKSHREDRFALSLHIYQLGDSLALLKVLQLDSIFVANFLTDLHADCKYIGPQMHLVIHSATDTDNVVSKLLEISSAAQTYQLQKVGRNRQLPATIDERKNASNNSAQSSCPAMDYLFHIFDKYATSPPLCSSQKSVDFHVLLNPPKKAGVNWDRVATENRCVEHMKSSLQKLMEKGKDFSKLELEVYAESLTDDWNLDTSLRLSQCTRGGVPSCMGRWIKQLVCLVPLQIARAENNTLKPLVNGLQIPSSAAYADAVSLANLIRFGLYDLVLASWGGDVRVISSMGKQSSGKSYLLNHLAGSLLDVAGGRCTDGVWMTMRSEADCLYVVLDFEGLGSFERSEQEDMLLSILNAAVSNVSIFNKKDFHLDKETEAIFQRFQDGVSLVKADEKLFRGLFYIAIKDVDASDVEDLKTEFIAKIRHICSKSTENFLTTMYGGEVEIAAMPPFQRPEFHGSIVDIGETIQELTSSYHSGRSFMLDLKLVIAQISARDWSPVDSKRLAMRLNLLRRHLVCAIRLGECLERGNLLDFDTEEEINEDPIQVEGFVFTVKDAGLELARDETDAGKMMGSVLRSLREAFEEVVKRKGSDEKWHSLYEAFLMGLIDRRRDRVLTWLQANTRDFPGDGDVRKLELEALAMLSEIKHRLALCSCKCGDCFLRCTLERGHPSDHSCLGNHACAELCTYCLEESEELEHIVHGAVLECNDLAGHHGAHDCKRRPHTCSKPCIFSGKSSNCNRTCSLRADHEGEHRCNSRQHMCDKSCSLPGCYNSCAVPFELGDHQQHACHEKFCPKQCSMDGCTRTCVTHNHFHALQQDVVHFCANEHPCQMPCEAPGICHVLTEIVKQTRSFHGKRGDFEYEYVSEQSEIRKSCCLLIPPSQQRHAGPHVHTTNSNAVHFCEVRCPACDYYCQLPIGHPGLHKTVHGNMRKMKFVSEVEEIDLLDRKYARGESGMAELCMMHCKARGRGHTHLIQCPASEEGGCCTEKLYDGARHATIQCKGLEVDVPMDEMTHETYWKNVRFVDPCEEGERAVFGLCDHFCRSEEHIVEGGGGSATTNFGGVAGRSYCTEKLWHAPVSRSGAFQGGGGGYVTEDGHHFACDHSRNMPHNVIFVIDKSGSMDSRDISPSMAKLVAGGHANRLGCVMEAMMRFIKMRLQATSGSSQGADSVSVVLFDNSAVTAARLEEMKEGVVETILKYRADGGTTYSSGLQAAEQVLRESRNAAEVQKKCPVVIFLSDGGNGGGVDPVYLVGRMKQEEPRLAVHTIMFGSDPSFRILQDMAAAGDGTFQLSLDEVQLAKSFEGLARSLKPKLAALCSST